MLKVKKRALITALMIVLVLTVSVNGTLAYLADKADEVTNTFTPPTVDVTITDKVEGDTKKDVVITNDSSFPVYVRVAIVANWRDVDGKIVAPLKAEEEKFTKLAPSPWKEYNGFYYYTEPVAAGAQVPTALFESFTYVDDDMPEGAAYLEMDLLVQSVQSSPAKAAQDVWGVTIIKDSVTAAQ